MCDRRWQQRFEEARELTGADDTINGDLQWKWSQQGEGTRQQAEQEEDSEMGPVGLHLAQQPTVQRVIGVVGSEHYTPPSFGCSRICRIAAMDLAHSWSVRRAS